MESKIPLPTDSIYKFLAMFSLLLVIFSVGAVIYASNSTNAVGFEHWVELEVLQAVEEPTLEQTIRRKVIEKKIEIAVADKKTYIRFATILAMLGTVGAIFGFGYWHLRVQPLVDQMSQTQLEIAKLQLLALKTDLKSKGVDVGAL